MLRKVAKRPTLTAAHAATPPTIQQTGTKESPILLLSDDEREVEEDICRPLAATQKTHLGVSPSDPYTFKGHGSAYDIMIAMGYKPDRGLGPSLRGNVRPLPIELRKPSTGVGYRTTSLSRSPSPAPPPKKAPVKIIRPPREPIASTSKIERSITKVAPQTGSRLKRAEKSAPLKSTLHHPPPNPPKQSVPTKQLLSPLTVIPPPPPSPAPFAPSDLYISLMSGLAMANMPQAMQVAATADPMAAFQLAQMCFAPPSPFPLPPFPLVPPQPDTAPIQHHIHTPNLPPKPVSSSTTKSNAKITPLPLLTHSSVLREVNPSPTPLTSTDPSSATIEMDHSILKQIRQARKNSIGWIPEPGFPGRGIFDLVPTMDYVRWSSSDDITPPDSQRSLVMEDLPCNCRTVEFVRFWADQFLPTSICLNANGKALIEFPSRKMAKAAYDSPRLRGGLFDRATHVRVFWYRPQVGDVVPSSKVATNENTGGTGELMDVSDDTILANTITAHEEPVPMVIDDLTLKVETTDIGQGAQLNDKGTPPPPPELDLPVRPPMVPAFTSRPKSHFVVTPTMDCDQGEQRMQSDLVDRNANVSREGSDHGTSRPPCSLSPSVPSIPLGQAPPRLRSLSPEVIQRKRTPPGSPPSLRYPSSTPEMTTDKGVPRPSEETSVHAIPSPTSGSDPLLAGDYSLEQQLRMRLLAVKGARIADRSRERSSSSSTPSTVVDHNSDAFLKTASPPPVSGGPNSVAISESLELLATSFITDTIQAAQGSPSEPERFDTAIKERLDKKRGFKDAFGSSADFALKRQQLAQEIEESKKTMNRFKVAKTKEEKDQIYRTWEESNRLFMLALVPFEWPCHAQQHIVLDSDDEEDTDSS